MSLTRLPLPTALSYETLALVMAGGSGTRLRELTRWHAKPALPFGGQYRNIDFPLSNCLNSGIRHNGILTQYMAHSLIQHVHQGWSSAAAGMGEFVEVWPAQQRRGAGWYAGTADAVFQNLDLIERHAPARVLVLAGDHVYKMDYAAMLEAHVTGRAGVTVGTIEVPIEEASAFGVVGVDPKLRIVRFDEKPSKPTSLPHDPARALASMGIYVFERDVLVDCLEKDARNSASSHDFGHDLLPSLVDRCRVRSFALRNGPAGRPAYWRDVGNVDSYWAAHMDLLDERPSLVLHDPSWPLRTHLRQSAPPRFTGAGSARCSIVSGGCVVEGEVERSVLSTDCRVHTRARIEQTVVLPGAEIGRGCRIRRAVIDGGCCIPPGTVIGADLWSAGATYYVSPHGVALVTAETPADVADRGARRVA
jgi:glucose-1-phosphate adenylyltransferase